MRLLQSRYAKSTMETPKKLSKAQIELLALFEEDVPEEDWIELRRLIARYFAVKATRLADAVVEERGWTADDFERMLHAHHRTSD